MSFRVFRGQINYYVRGNQEIREKPDTKELEWGNPENKNLLVHRRVSNRLPLFFLLRFMMYEPIFLPHFNIFNIYGMEY